MNKRIPYHGLNRRNFLGKAATAVAAATILPRHVYGGAKFVPPERKGERRHHRVRRSGADQPAGVAEAVGRPGDGGGGSRWSPRTTTGSITGVWRGVSRQGGDREALPEEEPRVPLCRVRGFPGDAGEGEGDRRGVGGDAGPWSCARRRCGRCGRASTPIVRSPWRTMSGNAACSRSGEGNGVATQMGNQGHSGTGIRQTVEWLRDGAIGEPRRKSMRGRTRGAG
jgi:hypothetical protein